ncbi:MAG: cytochrome c [Gammaproteobacteria bacterium]|nr:MAG: cytochrome c [Gammaproteobacteria bacterium]
MTGNTRSERALNRKQTGENLSRPFRTAICALLFAGILTSAPVRADGKIESLTADEARGKLIYTTSRGAAGRLLYFRLLTAGERALPANGIVCANCHGADGKGGREGNIVMADITYRTLSRPLPASPPWNKARAPYTDALLARAITRGLDSSGQQLDSSMPRWILSDPELQDLLKYLKRVGNK